MRISDWSSDVCSSDLYTNGDAGLTGGFRSPEIPAGPAMTRIAPPLSTQQLVPTDPDGEAMQVGKDMVLRLLMVDDSVEAAEAIARSEERRVGKEWVSRCKSGWATDH